MKLSVIIPAYNEEKLITRCVESVVQAFKANAAPDWSGEIIVANNNSSDATGELARKAGAKVVFESQNNISRARNAGARAASGDWFLFIDADTVLSAGSLAELLRSIRRDRFAGGGSLMEFDDPSVLAKIATVLSNWNLRTSRLPFGIFLFCRASAFRDLGGFPTDLYATEDTAFVIRLIEWGDRRGLDVAILHRHRHVASARKFRLYRWWEVLRYYFLSPYHRPSTLRDPKKLPFHYDGRR
jgi:glycosyltransferase involved in cell wall biosynthesis